MSRTTKTTVEQRKNTLVYTPEYIYHGKIVQHFRPLFLLLVVLLFLSLLAFLHLVFQLVI